MFKGDEKGSLAGGWRVIFGNWIFSWSKYSLASLASLIERDLSGGEVSWGGILSASLPPHQREREGSQCGSVCWRHEVTSLSPRLTCTNKLNTLLRLAYIYQLRVMISWCAIFYISTEHIYTHGYGISQSMLFLRRNNSLW